VVGYGYWGPRLVASLAGLTNARVKAVADIDPARRAAAKARYPWLDTTSDYGVLVTDDDIDAIVIATPLLDHYPIARAALAGGKHVLVEGPLADSLAAGRELDALATARGRTLMVHHARVYGGAVTKLREWLDAGRLGRLNYFFASRVELGMSKLEHNVLWELAARDLAVLDYVFGPVPEWISVIATSHLSENEDLAFVSLGYDDDVRAQLHCNWYAPRRSRQMTITGSDRMIAWDDANPTEPLKLFEHGTDADQLDLNVRHAMRSARRSGDVLTPKLDPADAMSRALEAFVSACDGGPAPRTDAKSALRVLAVLDAGQQSLEHDGERIELSIER